MTMKTILKFLQRHLSALVQIANLVLHMLGAGSGSSALDH